MKSSIPATLPNVTATTKANIYFDGKVMSHTLEDSSGAKITLGLIQPGSWHFGTGKAEKMEIVAGSCHVVLDGEENSQTYTDGSTFEIPANSGFTISVADGICEYICTFLD